ncbi:MAG: hypothetical protein JWN46_1556 [Acidimicrobiales bacterium]|nr:hypothetical protein [Acidimicrobiales bacterium]
MNRRLVGAFVLTLSGLLAGMAPIGGSLVAPAAAATLPPNDPPVSIPKNPAFPSSCAFGAFDSSAKCQTATLAAIANARAQEGVGPLVLPSNYGSLTRAQQIFVVINIERVDRKLPPIMGLVDALDFAAAVGAAGFADPVLPGGYPLTGSGSIFAGGAATVLGTLYDWMYFDGLRGVNPACTSSSSPECWIHRNIILGTYDNNPSSMGAAGLLGSYRGSPITLFAALLVGDRSGARPAYSFTWAQEVPYLTPPPAVRTFTPISGPASGGTTVTLTGLRLNGITALVFGGAGSATNLRPSADGTSLTATTPPSKVGPVSVTARFVQGTSTVGRFTYVASGPSAPRSVTATVPAAGRATVSWTGPASDGGSAITGYTVTPFAYGKVAQPAKTFGAATTSAPFTGLVDGQTFTFKVVAANAVGAGVSATSPMVLPPFTSLTAFVQRVYADCDGSLVPAVQLLAEVGALLAGAHPEAYPVSLRRSTDGTTNVDPVARLYFAYFLRIPDKVGLTYWIGRKRGGTPLNDASSAFAASPEFTKRYGPLTNLAFVQLVYTNVLGRAGDSSGVAFWTKQLDTRAQTRGQVMVGFSESGEYKRKKAQAVDVAVAWIDMLGASPDQTTFDTWTADLTSGAKQVEDLMASLLADPRYAARVRG